MDEYHDEYNYLDDEINNANDKNRNGNQKEQKMNHISYKKIQELYKVIILFRKGKKIVEEPNVFKYLTEEKFVNWIIKNSPKFKTHKISTNEF